MRPVKMSVSRSPGSQSPSCPPGSQAPKKTLTSAKVKLDTIILTPALGLGLHVSQIQHPSSDTVDDALNDSPLPEGVRLEPLKNQHRPTTSGKRSAAQKPNPVMLEPPFEKKPLYPLLVNFTKVQQRPVTAGMIGGGVRSPVRAANKAKITRSLFGGKGDETSSFSSDSQSDFQFVSEHPESQDSVSTIEAVKDMGMLPNLRLPGKMTEREAAVWLDRWVDSFNDEQGLFSSTSNFTDIKFLEMLEVDNISVLTTSHVARKSKMPPSDLDTRKPNAFRTAVCFNLFDRIVPQLGSFAPLVKRLLEEIAKSVYSGLKVSDMQRYLEGNSKDTHYAFKAVPYFVDNIRLMEKVQDMKDGFLEARERMRLAEEQSKRLREELVNMEARLDGYRMRVQTMEVEFTREQEERFKEKRHMLGEMQQLRDKIVQAAINAAQMRANAAGDGDEGGGAGGGGGGGGGGVEGEHTEKSTAQKSTSANGLGTVDNPTVHTLEVNPDSILSRIEAFEYLEKSVDQAMASMQEEYNFVTASVQIWRQTVTEAHDVSCLLTRTGETIDMLPQMQVPDLLLKWIEYHVKQSRQQIIVGDGPQKPNNLTTDMADCSFLIQVINQVMPRDKQLQPEAIIEVLESPIGQRIGWIGEMICEVTGDLKWLMSDTSNNQGQRMEMLLLLLVTRPSLDGNVFGVAKVLQNMLTQVTTNLEEAKRMYAPFSVAMRASLDRNEPFDVVATEIMIRAMGKCRADIGYLTEKIPEVARELTSHKDVLGKIVFKVASYLQERSNSKIVPGSEDEENVSEEGESGNAKESQPQKEGIIKTMKKQKTHIDVLPGYLNKVKGSLSKPVLSMLSNLSLEKLKDVLSEYAYSEKVRILEKCAMAAIVNYDLLRRTFRFYCKMYRSNNIKLLAAGGAALSFQSWNLLLFDIAFLGPSFGACPPQKVPPEMAKHVFDVSNYVLNNRNGQYGPDNDSSGTELRMFAFVECLVRTAHVWSKRQRKDIIFGVQSLMASIERSAKRDLSDEFRLLCRAQEVQDVLMKYLTQLTFTYNVYSGVDTSGIEDPDMSHLDSMNLKEFIQLTKDARIQDINFTQPEIMNVFIYVQDDGSIISNNEEGAGGGEGGGDVGGGMTDDTEMDYGEFCEALCACSCYKTLDPYVTLSQKLEILIVNL